MTNTSLPAPFENTLAYAQKLDEQDSLKHLRAQFSILTGLMNITSRVIH